MIRLTAVIEVEGHAPRALTHESNARIITLGRDETADFQLPLSTISRHHARISEVDGVYTVEDLGSTHGTKLGGKALTAGEKRVLRHGDIIEMTRARVTVAIEASRVASVAPGEGTQAIAARAVQGILGRMGEPAAEGPYLRVLSGKGEGTRFNLGGAATEWTLGRSQDVEIVLDDANVSRRHAQVKKDQHGFLLVDLGSRNGLSVNDKLVRKPRRLRDRDELAIGPIRLVFVDPDADLLEALKDVPGFALEPSQSGEVSGVGEPPAGEAGASPAAPEALPAVASGAEVPPPPVPDPAVEEAAALASIDESLLAEGRSRAAVDVVVFAVLGVIALAGVAFAGLVLW